MSQSQRFRAKVANVGFRNARFEQDDIVEVNAEEAASMSHHWEPLGVAKDGSDDSALKQKLAEQEKLDHLKNKKMRETYDEVRPSIPAGGPATPVEKRADQVKKDAADRKAEEKANEARRGKGNQGRQPVVVDGAGRVVVEPKTADKAVAPVNNPPKLPVNAPVNRPGLQPGQPSGRPVMPSALPRK